MDGDGDAEPARFGVSVGPDSRELERIQGGLVLLAQICGRIIIARSKEGVMEKQSQPGAKKQSKGDRPKVGPDQTTMFNPQTQSYDIRQKTPAEIARDRDAGEPGQTGRQA
jgi:hypothetical protein